MQKYQQNLLWGTLAILVVIFGIRMFWPDGTITVDFENAPVSKVLASIERQGRVALVTNLPAEATVTIQMKRAPLLEVLETLAVRTETELRAVAVAAPKRSDAAAAFEGLSAEKRPENLEIAYFPSMGGPPEVIDARALMVKPEATEKGDLQSAFQQVAQKSGMMAVCPKDWNPAVPMPSGKDVVAADLLRSLVKSSGGGIQEGFFLYARGARPDEGGPRPDGATAGRPPWDGAGGGGGRPRREGMNPEWVAQRAEAAIAQLPKEAQAAAKAELNEMRQFWTEVRSLPDDQRRAKMEEFFSRPDVQEKMAARQEARDNRRTPEQREQRMKSYIERKKQMKAAGTTP